MDITHVCVALLGTGEKYRNFNSFFQTSLCCSTTKKVAGGVGTLYFRPALRTIKLAEGRDCLSHARAC
jgi:hypothetical protein